jgi:hypothetical protein
VTFGAAYEFMTDLASRLRGRVQLTTDGHQPYLETVEAAFGTEIDYATLAKIYGSDSQADRKYVPAVCIGCKVETVTGSPNPKHISPSHNERQSLSKRMLMRRFTRLTTLLKRRSNHAAAMALYFIWYNFGRVHQTLRVTPAMEARVSDHVWSVEEIVALLAQRAA